MKLNAVVEKRLYTRMATVLPVKIFYNDVYLESCNTINVSVGGALIETGEIAFTENSLIQVKFDLDESNYLGQTLIPAIVRRSDYHKIAIAFERLEKDIEGFIGAS